MGFGPDDVESAVNAFREISQIAAEDGIAFDAASVQGVVIRKEAGYPVLLDDLPAPQLRSYPKYTVVAEKFHAVCLLGMANTRMKDHFDPWVLMTEGTLDPHALHRAIAATFERRKLAMPRSLPAGLSDGFSDDGTKKAQWAAFLKKNRLEAIDLAHVVTRLREEFKKCGVF